MLADSHPAAFGLARYGPSVYFTNYDADGGVFRIHRQGGGEETLLSIASPSQIAIDESGLYVTGTDDGTILRLPGTTGTPQTLATDQSIPTDLALDGNYVYWVSHGGAAVRRTLRVGGSAIEDLVVGIENPYRLALSDAYVYFSTAYVGPYRVAKDGGAPELLSSGGAHSVAVRDSYVVWTDRELPGIVGFDENTLQVEILALLDSEVFADGITLDGGFVYWTQADGTVWRLSRSGGEPELLASDPGGRPTLIAVDASCVYWTAGGSGGDVGHVMRAPNAPE